MDPDLSSQFEAAQARVKQLSRRPDNRDLLALYGLYKQATVGDATGSRPGALDFKGRAKYDAWSGYRGQSSEVCMREYIELVDRLAGG